MSNSTWLESVHDNVLGLFQQVGVLETVLLIACGVCLLVLLLSIIYFCLLYKFGRFSDNPYYQFRHRFDYPKYESMTLNGTIANPSPPMPRPTKAILGSRDRASRYKRGKTFWDNNCDCHAPPSSYNYQQPRGVVCPIEVNDSLYTTGYSTSNGPSSNESVYYTAMSRYPL